MGYLPAAGMGDIAAADFNSTKYPGICKPSTVSVLATFKRLQTQLNRCAASAGARTIAVDGDIGPGTMTLFGALKSHLGTYAAGKGDVVAASKISSASSTSCVAIASIADVIADVADSYADSIGAPAKAPAPTPTKPPMLVMPNGTEKSPPLAASLLTSFESAPMTHKIALLAVAGGIGYVAFKQSKKRRRR